MRARRRTFLAAALPLLAAPAPAQAQAPTAALTIAAASDLRFALDEVLRPFRQAHAEVRLEVIYGASGKLATQVRHGAPFDVFLSADRAFADELQRAGFTAGAPRLYAIGHLAAWSAEAALGRLPLAELVRHPAVRRFAIANPEHAPYGRRAMEALQSQGLADVVRPKLVLGANVAQAAQFVETGAAQAGLVALSLVLSPGLSGKGAYTRVPQAWHQPLEQALVVTRRAADNARAHAFVAYLETPPARATLRRCGFALPGE
ncbi:MAG: molybdate ABC transporter substrate-binding protein [Rubrivivax sp.]|nr:molybdate ABC transporter substrate-binding protein [Rubrivivax sp.]